MNGPVVMNTDTVPRAAERVLADVEKALDAEIEDCERVIAEALGRIRDQESLLSRARYALAVLTEVRRAARGGRDGGGE